MPVTAAMQVWNHEVFAQPETLSKKFDYKEENSEKTVKEYPAKRILLATIEYEETELTNGLDYIKTKYTVLEENKISLPDTPPSSQESQGEKKPSISEIATVIALPQPKKILYDPVNIVTGFHTLNGIDWAVGAGMVNVGNSCYLNSTLQAIFHVPSISNFLISDSEHREICQRNDRPGCIICVMAETLILSQNVHTLKPAAIYNRLRSICRHLVPGRQEDAHEFLRHLIESMERSYLNRTPNSADLDQFSKETTPLNQILGGYLRSTVTCLSCCHKSTTFQHFEDLQLDITDAQNVEDALNAYFANENLETDGYRCEACKKPVSASKKFSMEKAPIALCIQLKPFSETGNKLIKNIHVGQYLDLEPYMTENRCKKSIYRLTSMITHLGATRHCGHYTAIGLTSSDKYYEFDDSHVHVMSYDDVARTNGYILFYELVNEMKDKSEIPATISSAEHARLNSKSAMGGGSSTSQKTERVLVEGPKFMTPSILKNYQHQRLKPIVISKGENGEFQTNQNYNRAPRLTDDQYPLKSSNSLVISGTRNKYSNNSSRWQNPQSPQSLQNSPKNTYFARDSQHAKKRHRDDDDRDWEMDQRSPKKTHYSRNNGYNNNYNRPYDYNQSKRYHGAQENNYQFKGRSNSHTKHVPHKLFQQRRKNNHGGHSNNFVRRN